MTVGVLHALDHTGDVKLEWDTSRPEEVTAARLMFDRLRQESRYAAYRVQGDDRETVHDWDADRLAEAEAIVMAPAPVGG